MKDRQPIRERISPYFSFFRGHKFRIKAIFIYFAQVELFDTKIRKIKRRLRMI